MKKIPYGHHWVDDSDIEEVIKVLKSDWITQGPKIEQFENALAEYAGTRYAVAVSSGTAALHCACLASGIGAGDEVVTSPITFAASSNSIIYCGGRPVFADIEADTMNIDPGAIIGKITEKTRAIIPVHFAGHPCDMKKIYDIAKKFKLTLIEDAAHALGAVYKGSKIGACKYSDMTVFSFHPVKTITTGEGGSILTNDKDLYKKLLLFRNHGITRTDLSEKQEGDWYYEMQVLGYNYRITDIQAALGISQLKKVGSLIKRRRYIAGIYDEAFNDKRYFDVPVEKDYAYSSYHIYTIRLPAYLAPKRKAIFSELRRKGLGVQVHYIPVYKHPYYRSMGYEHGSCPVAEDAYKCMISIPIYPKMKDSEVGYVIKAIKDVMRKATRGIG